MLTINPSSLKMDDQIEDWLHEFKQQNFLLINENGLPNKKNERYKYTDLSFLKKHNWLVDPAPAFYSNEEIKKIVQLRRLKNGIVIVLVDGKYVPELSDLKQSSSQIIICSINDALVDHPQLVKEYWQSPINFKNYPFSCINGALFDRGLFLYVQDDCKISQPIQILTIVKDNVMHPRHLILVGKNSCLTLAEEIICLKQNATLANPVSMITLDEGANFEYVKVQNMNAASAYFSQIELQQFKNSHASLFNFSLGGHFSRDDLILNLRGAAAKCMTNGFYHVTEDHQYVDNHVEVNHLNVNTQSDMFYKGIVRKKAKAVFNGKVTVKKEALRTVAKQKNHNLILSAESEVYTKPELEIYADDVQCQHGATVGELNEDALFYLSSRGINKQDAKNILLHGFSKEVIQRIQDPQLTSWVQEMVYCLC